MKNRTIGVIPARYASTRFPGKPLVELCGKPLLHWVIERAGKARLLDELLVATDDARIMACAMETGVRTVMTATSHHSGTDRIAEAVNAIDAEAIINIQGDEPLIDPVLIDRLAETMDADNTCDMVTAVTPIGNREEVYCPDVVKVVMTQDGRALYFSRAPVPYPRDAAPDEFAEGIFLRHIGIYGYRRHFLESFVITPPSFLEDTEKLEQLRALEMGAKIRIVKAERASPGVDRPEDIPEIEQYIRKGYQ